MSLSNDDDRVAMGRLLQGQPIRTALFAGEGAANADHGALARAKTMTDSGEPKDKVYDATKWWTGNDNKWRFEIDDSAAKLAPRANSVYSPAAKEGDKFGTVQPSPGKQFHPGVGFGEFMQHEALKQAYPDIYQMPRAPKGNNLLMHFWKNNGEGEAFTKPAIGQVPASEDDGSLGPSQYMEVTAPNRDVARSVGLHEAQHYIQNREGFTGGTDPSVAGTRGYLDNHGEIEARVVQQRVNMTKEERAQSYPWLTPPMKHRHE
jgi:hypothetical protein